MRNASAVMCKRRQGGGGWLPSDIPNAVAWWDADDSTSMTLSGSDVTSWVDKIGSLNLNYNNSGAWPTLVAAEKNGNDVVRFNGSTQRILVISATTGIPVSSSTDWAFIGAYKNISQATTQIGMSSGQAYTTGIRWALFGQGSSGTGVSALGWAGATSNVDLNQNPNPNSAGEAYISSYVKDAAGWAIDRTDLTGYTKADTSTPTDTVFSICLGTEVTGTYSANMDWYELVIVRGTISAGDMATLKAYLAAKWAIA